MRKRKKKHRTSDHDQVTIAGCADAKSASSRVKKNVKPVDFMTDTDLVEVEDDEMDNQEEESINRRGRNELKTTV